MLEVLITILIIAGALLGTAGMQAYGLKLTQGSQFRTQAVFVANDIIERLAANNAGAVAGSYVATVSAGGGGGSAPDCNAAACTAQELAAFDLGLFETRLRAALPGASATITRTGAGPWIYTVAITWEEARYKPKGSTSASSATTEAFTFIVSRTVYDRSLVI